MPRFERIANRIGMKAKLKQLQRMLKIADQRLGAVDEARAAEFKRGYELGGLAMKKAIQQATDEAKEKA